MCVCVQNVTANHRVHDVIVTEDGPQTLVGRFMYGPLDMVTLAGEKVLIKPLTAAHKPHQQGETEGTTQ